MARIDHQDSAFRTMLINLDKLIHTPELERMKFQSKSMGIGERMLDRIKTSLDLWSKLEERGHLGKTKLTFLKKLLETCCDNRTDLWNIVSQYETYRPNPTIVNQNGSSGEHEDLSKEILFLEQNLGRDWKFFMRFVGLPEAQLENCVDSHPRNVKEQIHMAFKECQSDLTKTKILQALKDAQRNDLYHKIDAGLP